jgi:hypothetical protein
MRRQAMLRPGFSFAALLAFTLSAPDAALARQVPSSSDNTVDVGLVAGPGWLGTLAAARFSLPVWPRADVDLDAGRFGWSDSNNESLLLSLQFRIFDRPRGEMSRTHGFILGVSVARGGVAPAFGYGFDVLATRRARLGAEVTTGGSPNAGPRAFAKLYLVWRAGAR